MKVDFIELTKTVSATLSEDATKEFEDFWETLMQQPEAKMLVPMRSTLQSIFVTGYVRGARMGLQALYGEIMRVMGPAGDTAPATEATS